MCWLLATSRTITVTSAGSLRHVRSRIFATPSSFSRAGSRVSSTARKRSMSCPQFSTKIGAEHVVLRREVVVQEAVRDARVLRRCRRRARRGTRAPRTLGWQRRGSACASHPAALVLRGSVRLNGQSTRTRIEVRSAGVQPLAGTARRRPHALPARRLREPRAHRGSALGSSASSRLAATRCADAHRLGHRASRGKESVVCDLPADASFARALCAPRRRRRSKASGPASRPASGSARTTSRARPSTARSPASADDGAPPHAGRSRPQLPRLGRRPRGHARRRSRRSRSPTSPPARSAR